jgi:hypothetical protein
MILEITSANYKIISFPNLTLSLWREEIPILPQEARKDGIFNSAGRSGGNQERWDLRLGFSDEALGFVFFASGEEAEKVSVGDGA